jgi:starch synthase (maltosyl-transferring)
MASYFRPNFFVNTPDILPPILQRGGRPAFKARLVLAATLSPTYGIYSGFELCENTAIEGREEYLDSEKYEIKVRDWNAAGNIKDFIARVNLARRENPVLHRFANLRFLDIDDDELIAYVKWDSQGGDPVIVVINLDPFAAHEGMLHVPADTVGMAAGDPYDAHDLLTGDRYAWEEWNYVRLDPAAGEPAHLVRLQRR